MDYRPVSKTRKMLIDEKNNSPLVVGELVAVNYYGIMKDRDKKREYRSVNCIITDINDDKIKVKYSDNSIYKSEYVISKEDIIARDTYKIGANPFDEKTDYITTISFTCDSILFNLNIIGTKSTTIGKFTINNINITELNWNPFVYTKDGSKQYYQRGFVWNNNNNQLLIESIYKGVDCGKILIRKRGWNELKALAEKGETELAFNDIVDGKQRLNAIRGFIMGEFKDLHGNLFEDLSAYSQNKLTDHQLFSYGVMPENTKDEDVINQLLKLNITHVPQSKKHIEFVKSIHCRL